MHLSRNVLYYGKDESLPEQKELRAGPLSVFYEAGDLRYIKLGDREILRRVYVAVRDRNWGTVPMVLANVEMEIAHDTFRIAYDAEHRQGDIDFFWKGTITGDREGTITFTMDGVARSTFLRNRIGFCVLHPIRECAGVACTVEHIDGTVEQGTFPKYISPHQPFMEMQAIAHEVVPGVSAEVRFAGDVFEMEDQRNWTDASYKTYCTPLRLPFPVEVRAGTRISQSVTMTLRGTGFDLQMEPVERDLTFSLAPLAAGPLPDIGFQGASHGQPLSEKELARLKALNLAHLRLDLHLSQPDYVDALRRGAEQAHALGVPLEIALILSDDAARELEQLVAELHVARPDVKRWLIFHKEEKSTSERWVRLAREYLSGYGLATPIGAGTNMYFTELNRGRPPVQALDLLSYSINPQVHAFDNASLVETLEAQAATVESARRFAGGLPVAISPVTLKPRFNPDATGAAPEPAPGELPAPVDRRQMSLFGAGWTLGSLKYLAESGVASVTYYETSGWRGVMETEDGSPLPDVFRSLPGSVFPLYHVLADAGEFAGGEVVPSTSSNTLRLDGLTMRKDGKTRVLIANLGVAPQTVRVRNLPEHVRVRRLDETNAEEAMLAPESFRAHEGELLETSAGELELTLLPYAIARIDTAAE